MDAKPYFAEEEFRGHALAVIYTGHSYQGKEETVSMGLRKAIAVCDCIDALRAWCERQEGRSVTVPKERGALKREADRILANAGTPMPDDDMPF